MFHSIRESAAILHPSRESAMHPVTVPLDLLFYFFAETQGGARGGELQPDIYSAMFMYGRFLGDYVQENLPPNPCFQSWVYCFSEGIQQGRRCPGSRLPCPTRVRPRLVQKPNDFPERHLVPYFAEILSHYDPRIAPPPNLPVS